MYMRWQLRQPATETPCRRPTAGQKQTDIVGSIQSTTNIYIYIYVYTYLSLYIYICICMYVCMYIYIYIHMHTAITSLSHLCISCVSFVRFIFVMLFYVYSLSAVRGISIQ